MTAKFFAVARAAAHRRAMYATFEVGDYLAFQLESGYGLMRVLTVEQSSDDTIWHISIYTELFPDIESAEAALRTPTDLHPSFKHVALTDRAFERTPAARLGNAPLTEAEEAAFRESKNSANQVVYDRSVLQLIGIR
jgi:hypothetical protein